MTFYPFVTSCPSCTNETSSAKSHSNCGGLLEIDENCIVKCSKCQYRDVIMNWKFDCGEHNGQSWPIELRNAIHAIGTVGGEKGKEDKEWAIRLMKSLGQMVLNSN